MVDAAAAAAADSDTEVSVVPHVAELGTLESSCLVL